MITTDRRWRLTCCNMTVARSTDSETFAPPDDSIFSPYNPDRHVDPMMYSGYCHYDGACPRCGNDEPAVVPSIRVVIRK